MSIEARSNPGLHDVQTFRIHLRVNERAMIITVLRFFLFYVYIPYTQICKEIITVQKARWTSRFNRVSTLITHYSSYNFLNSFQLILILSS